jgi:hypothetical protein
MQNLTRVGLTAAIAAGFISLGGMAGASPVLLDFDGDICDTADGTCGNTARILQSYGDVAGLLDVQWDGSRSSPALEDFFFWETGYETLENVAYGQASQDGAEIRFVVTAPSASVTLSSFDIAPYVNRVRDSRFAIYDMADDSLLFDTGLFEVSTAGVTAFAGDWTSDVGLRFLLGPNIWDVAIDNISYSTSQVPQIPLPATGLLLLGALAVAGALHRRKG